MKKLRIVSKILVPFAMGILLFNSCTKEDEPKPLDLPVKSAELISSDNAFGLQLFKNVLEAADPEENVMISPLSVSLALSMAYNGANGETKIEMEQAMKMTGLSITEINDLNKQLTAALLAHDSKVTLEIANSIWYRNDFVVISDFIDVNQTYYDAEVRAMDFADPQTIDVINGWVKDKTHDRIESIVDQISAESFMFLINAIYFKGNWRYEFDKKDTRDGGFYVSENKEVTVPMMHQEVDINIFRNGTFAAIELPYGKGNWTMFVMVPTYDSQLQDILDELNNENWNSWMNSLIPSKGVNISMPKFSFEFESSLKEALQAMGMEAAFTTAADFSGILEGGGLMISDVKHKTFVEVNEEGTEAAAVTSVEIELTSAGNYFNVDRPFLFVIAETSSNTILFAGRVGNPLN